MGISESQLETWAHQGSITQSSDTYNTIKGCLEATTTPYSAKNYTVFLQGSYGNDTNIYAESDVDIVIRLDDCFYHDLTALSDTERAAFGAAYPGSAQYGYADFKRDVGAVLSTKYASDVKFGDKAIRIGANGGRRNADVIAAVQFKKYSRFLSVTDCACEVGICFWNRNGTQIANYPKQHSERCTRKHQGTGRWFKPMVRILKNLRGKLVETGKIAPGIAPSYYLEGLLFNVPDVHFGGTYRDTLLKSLDWILKADRSKFVCANGQYYLLQDGSLVSWRHSDCDLYLNAAVELWNA